MFALDEEFVDASPAVRIRRPGTEIERERVLSDAELRDVWMACDRLAYPHGQIYRLALLTGQRVGEVAGLRRSEITGDIWSLPGERTKGGKGHAIYLTPLAREVLADVPSQGDVLFSNAVDANTPASEFSHARQHLYAAVDAVRRERGETAPMPDWRPHDLRRTAATGMRGLRIDRLTVSKILNHSESGITKIYDRFSLDPEKRLAWEAWSRHVDSIVRGGDGGNVVTLVRA
jgi:integrase